MSAVPYTSGFLFRFAVFFRRRTNLTQSILKAAFQKKNKFCFKEEQIYPQSITYMSLIYVSGYLVKFNWSFFVLNKPFPNPTKDQKMKNRFKLGQVTPNFFSFLLVGLNRDCIQKISASADGGPRYLVCARQTVRSAPLRHTSGIFWRTCLGGGKIV